MSDVTEEWVKRTMEKSISDFVDGAQKLAASAPVSQVTDSIAASPAHVVLVVDDNDGTLQGIITPRDLGKLSRFAGGKAIDIATMFPVAISAGSELWQALQLMNGVNSQTKTVDTLPVVDSERKPVGVIVRSRLKNALDKMSY